MRYIIKITLYLKKHAQYILISQNTKFNTIELNDKCNMIVSLDVTYILARNINSSRF